tara:strand:- start:2304 stop:2513 length:210 start_codon:yes stop_codon:yes gene_type:complete
MKGYKQVHLIVKDRGFVYEPVPNTPEFHNEESALVYWQNNRINIQDANFYNDPIVIIRREINNITVKNL